MASNPPIGVFDSGVGGLTVVRELRHQLPGWDILYLGDTARVPYGTRSPITVERYALACQRFLLQRHVSLVMVACNTVSATALSALEAVSPVPVIGAVEPGAATAVSVTSRGRVGVMGTLATVRSGAYERALERLSPGIHVTAWPCPLLVPLAEEGWIDNDIAHSVCERYLQELFERDAAIDTLLLGCTHYPLLIDTIHAVALKLTGREIAIVDSATAMARAAFKSLGSRTGAGALRCVATDAARMEVLAERFLGAPHRFELVDL